jgi:hypothetical protein
VSDSSTMLLFSDANGYTSALATILAVALIVQRLR